MDRLTYAFVVVVGICILCTLLAGVTLFIVGTLILIAKLIYILAIIGLAFIALGVIGLILAKLSVIFER